MVVDLPAAYLVVLPCRGPISVEKENWGAEKQVSFWFHHSGTSRRTDAHAILVDVITKLAT